MWFTGAAAKRLAGRSVDVAAHLRLHAQREAERRQQRQLEDDRRQQNQREAEAASARVAQRKERDREHAIATEGSKVHAALWRSRDDMEQWTVDASSLHPPAHMRTASDMSLPHAMLGHSAPVSNQLISSVVRIVRRADTASLTALFASLPPHTTSLLANLRNRTGDSLLHLCAASHPHMAIMAQLIRSRADVNSLNSHRDSPLHLACASRHHKAIKALLLAGADVEISNRDEKLCWEMSDTSGRNRRSGSDDDGQRRLRAFVQLLTSERDAEMLAADKEDRQQADDKVKQSWRATFYRRQQIVQRRKGREWSECQERQRAGSQSGSGSSSGSHTPVAVDAAEWFHDFAERALSDCEGVEEIAGRTARMRRKSSRGGDVDNDHWLYRIDHAGSGEEQPLPADERRAAERPRTTPSVRTKASRPQSAHSTRSLPVLLAVPAAGDWQQTHTPLVALNAATPRTRHQLSHRPQSRQGQRPHTAPSRHVLDGHVYQRPAAPNAVHAAPAEQSIPASQQRASQKQTRAVGHGRRERALSRGLLDSGQPPEAYGERRLRSFLY